MASRIAALIALFIVSACSIPQYTWHKPDADQTMLAIDEKACWEKQPPWFVTPGSAMGDPIPAHGVQGLHGGAWLDEGRPSTMTGWTSTVRCRPQQRRRR